MYEVRTRQQRNKNQEERTDDRMTYVFFSVFELFRMLFVISVFSGVSMYMISAAYSDPQMIFFSAIIMIILHAGMVLAFFVEYYTCAHRKFDDKEGSMDVIIKDGNGFHYTVMRWRPAR
jgi:hypothetical protein